MGLRDLLGRLTGRDDPGAGAAPVVPSAPGVPTDDDLLAALARAEAMLDATVPAAVTSRVRRITRIVRETVPRLDTLGLGSQQAHSVMATATDYLPEALGGYLRLPRQWADTRPVDNGKTSLMVLCDSLDLLGYTMEQIQDAILRSDAAALVAHGRFLQEKFGAPSTGGQLNLGGTT